MYLESYISDKLNDNPFLNAFYNNIKDVREAGTAYAILRRYIYGDNMYNLGTSDFSKGQYRSLKFINDIMSHKNFNKLIQVDGIQKFHNVLSDCALTSMCWLWRQYKIVYKFDKTFYKYFKDTDELDVYPMEILYIPQSVFYIDLSSVDLDASQKDIVGIIVCVAQSNDGVSVGCQFISDSDMLYSPVCVDMPMEWCYYKNGAIVYNYKRQWESDNLECESLVILVLQFLSYISCEKPDIAPTKSTVKKLKRFERLKKPCDQIQEYNVGYHYGKALSVMEEKAKVACTNSYQLDSQRNSPIPHLVSAHWHGYWCGKGRKQFKYKWLAPYQKGVGTLDVVLHDCIEVHKSQYSHGERILYNLLEQFGIDYIPQYRVFEINKIYDCKCTIDGVDCFIEFDGEQHFRQVRNWDFETTKSNDKLKNEYCRSNNIPLLRIKYNQVPKIYDMLKDLQKHCNYYQSCYNTYLSDNEYYEYV